MRDSDPALLSVREAFARLDAPFRQVLIGLIAALEAADPYNRGHSARVALISTLIGEELAIPVDELRVLNVAALLHDVGTVGIPSGIVNKPAPLSSEELAQIRQHPARGEAMLRHIPTLTEALRGVRSHHERWDGRGYPDGLERVNIPKCGRIVAVAEVYDAMTSPRAHRPAHEEPEVLSYLKRESGSEFAPEVVAAFFRVLERYRRLSVITGHFPPTQ